MDAMGTVGLSENETKEPAARVRFEWCEHVEGHRGAKIHERWPKP